MAHPPCQGKKTAKTSRFSPPFSGFSPICREPQPLRLPNLRPPSHSSQQNVARNRPQSTSFPHSAIRPGNTTPSLPKNRESPAKRRSPIPSSPSKKAPLSLPTSAILPPSSIRTLAAILNQNLTFPQKSRGKSHCPHSPFRPAAYDSKALVPLPTPAPPTPEAPSPFLSKKAVDSWQDAAVPAPSGP